MTDVVELRSAVCRACGRSSFPYQRYGCPHCGGMVLDPGTDLGAGTVALTIACHRPQAAECAGQEWAVHVDLGNEMLVTAVLISAARPAVGSPAGDYVIASSAGVEHPGAVVRGPLTNDTAGSS